MCEQCEYWGMADRPAEYFKYCFGVFWYNIDEARKLISPDRLNMCPVSAFSHLVDYPRNPADGMFGNMEKVPVDVEHLDHVDMKVPIIVAYAPKPDVKEEKRGRILIDGHHRIARAIRDGLTEIQCIILTPEESDSILIDNRPKRRRKKRVA